VSLIADGKSNAAIAAELRLSEHTVKRHVANILLKLDLPSRAAAAAFSARHTGPDDIRSINSPMQAQADIAVEGAANGG